MVQNVSQKQIFIKEMLSLVYVVCESLPGVDPVNEKKQKQKNLVTILSSPCKTSSNGIHLKTCGVIREPFGHIKIIDAN